MNIYYTAKDIEELAARGVRRLEIGPHMTLTDVARETAQAFNIELVQTAGAAPTGQPPAFSGSAAERYNKPNGCQHDLAIAAATPYTAAPAAAAPAAAARAATTASGAGASFDRPAACQGGPAAASSPAPATPAPARRDGQDAATVNKLIELVGKVMKRG